MRLLQCLTIKATNDGYDLMQLSLVYWFNGQFIIVVETLPLKV